MSWLTDAIGGGGGSSESEHAKRAKGYWDKILEYTNQYGQQAVSPYMEGYAPAMKESLAGWKKFSTEPSAMLSTYATGRENLQEQMARANLGLGAQMRALSQYDKERAAAAQQAQSQLEAIRNQALQGWAGQSLGGYLSALNPIMQATGQKSNIEMQRYLQGKGQQAQTGQNLFGLGTGLGNMLGFSNLGGGLGNWLAGLAPAGGAGLAAGTAASAVAPEALLAAMALL